MKTSCTSQMNKVIAIYLVIVFLFIVNISNAQYYTIRKYDALNNFTPSQLFQYSNFTTNNMALLYNGSTYQPSAAFQIKDNLSAYRPLFQVDGVNVGSIKHWYYDGTTNGW
jgi:hypothetical protein